MKYNINELCTCLEKKYNTADFDYMKSFKDLVIYLLSFIKAKRIVDIKIEKTVELDKFEFKKLNKYISQVVVRNIPIEYITGFTYIYNEKILVNKKVLIPRPDSETLIETAIEKINKHKYNTLLDMCTGSGVVGICISKNSSINKITLVDISNKALKLAAKNCILNEVSNYIVKKSNLFSKIEKNDTYDIITVNPPYLTTAEMKNLPKNVKHEPSLALDAGLDGLDYYRRIIKEAYKYLNVNGTLVLEIGYNQAIDVLELINLSNKYQNITVKQDINKKDRVVVCRFQKK